VRIGYARVSTLDQSPNLQLDALKAAGCEKIFNETASGAQRDRPELAAALHYAREGDSICVWRLDRLGRSLKQLIETVEGLEAKGIGLRSLNESIDTTTPGGRLIFHVFGALAQFERELIKERTAAGLASARAQGKVGGRPSSMTEKDVAAARAMLTNSAITMTEVAKRLNVSVATLYRHIPGGRGCLDDAAT
jgi:DNA invertase Pin-like site-specific DNA recombinase